MQKNAVLYRRVSTQRQTDEGVSLKVWKNEESNGPDYGGKVLT